jgi:hypothetical protein
MSRAIAAAGLACHTAARRNTVVVRIIACVLAGALSLAACDPFSAYGKAPRDDVGFPAVIHDASAPEPDAGPGDCEHVRPPRRDAHAAAGDEIEFVVAAREIAFGVETAAGSPRDPDQTPSPNYLSFGFDLDDRCSSTPTIGNACITPSWSVDRIDGPGGRDNSVGELYAMLGVPSAINDVEIADGTLTSVVRVRGYNGKSSDDRVTVEWFAATTITHAGGRPTPPAWDGHDQWLAYDLWDSAATPADVADAEPDMALRARRPVAQYYDDRAYVVDHQLVAHFPELLVAPAPLSHALITASIRKVDDGWALHDGTVGGRMRIDAGLRVIEVVGKATGQTVCTDSPLYLTRKKLVCSFADVSFAGPDDGSQPCDAASFQWRFSADPAELAGVVRHEGIVNPLPCPSDVSTVDESCADLAP